MTATEPCPICGAPVPRWERYPGLVCPACVTRARDEHGRPLRLFNESVLGTGFFAEAEEGGTWRRVAGGRCFIDGRECLAGEHRFGGVVVQTRAE